MAHDQLPDLKELATELVHLLHRQRDLVRHYEKALERIAAFPNEFEQARAATLATKLDEMGARIEYLERSSFQFAATTIAALRPSPPAERAAQERILVPPRRARAGSARRKRSR
jgi:hypothetical protein